MSARNESQAARLAAVNAVLPLADAGPGNSAMFSPRRSRRRPGENRERLLAAGIAQFAHMGFRGTSTTAIATAAEVPQPHVYTNFRTKQELFLACVDVVGRQLLEDREQHSSAAEGTEHAQLLLQAVAAMGERSLQPGLGELLTEVQSGLGRDAFEQLLLTGAAAQLALQQ